MEKILLLSHPRSGSTAYCAAFNSYYEEIDNNYVPVIEEVYMCPENHRIKFKKKHNLNSEKIKNVNQREITKAFLYAFKHETFIMKYFPYSTEKHCNKSLNVDFIISKCLEANVKINFLYRKNILESVVSYIISVHNKIWHFNKINVNNKNIFYNAVVDERRINSCINYVLNDIKLSHDYFNKFKNNNLIKDVLTYEDNIITKNFKYSNYLPDYFKKLNSNENKKVFLNNNPTITETLKKTINLYNIDCSDNFIINKII